MKKFFILISLLVLIFASNILAQGNGFGLGIILGEPTGISGKLWLNSKSAVDGAVAWSFDKNSAMHLHGDYILHNFKWIEVEEVSPPVYFGIGGRIRFHEGKGDDNVGVRIPVGLDYIFSGAPLDLFLEVVPILDLVPDTDFDINAALGIRYFF